MPLLIEGKATRLLLIVLELIAFLGLAAWIVMAVLAYRMSKQVSTEALELAVRLDRRNSEYHRSLGHLYEYMPANLKSEMAEQEFRLAVHLDPYDPGAWLDLAAALLSRGKIAESEQCLRKADFLAPNIPAFQWPIANYYLLHEDLDEAFRHFRIVLAGTSQYDQIVFTTAWKASGDAEKILQELIPRMVTTEFSYLYYLLSQQYYSEAHSVWKRILSNSTRFNLREVALYIDILIAAHRSEEAHQVWTDLGAQGLIRSALPGFNKNLLTDGDFEDEILNMGFGWRFVPVKGVYVGLDQTTFHSPGHSLFMRFRGKDNLDYRQAYQFVRVLPGHSYRLQAFMKTEGITTDSGPRLEVRDWYESSALEAFSEDLTASTPSWLPLTLDFKTGPKTDLIVVGLARFPSRKLDSLIAGKVWLDDVRLTLVK